MRGQSYDRRRVYEEGKLGSHFLGLQCVLDKYQHQNNILCQKVSFLIQQNKRLRTESIFKSTTETFKPVSDTTNLRELKYEYKRLNQPLKIKNKYERQQPYQSYLNKPYQPKLSSMKNPKLQFVQQDPTKTQRKYSYISKAQDLIEKRRNNYLNQKLQLNNTSLNYVNEGNETERISWRQRLKTQPIKYSPRTCKEESTKKIIPKKKFTKQVYLQEQTVTQDEVSSQKSPTFIQASFGNQQSKQQITKNIQLKASQKKDPINKQANMKQKKSQLEKGFKLEKRQGQKEFKYVLDQKKIENQIPKPAFLKKTNSPYIESDYKITEPKTQLAKLIHRQKQQQQNKPMIPNNSLPKKTFLSITTKTIKANIFR